MTGKACSRSVRRRHGATLAVAAGLFVLAGSAHAAGPRPGEVYTQFGIGLLTPDFNLDESVRSTAPSLQEQQINGINLRILNRRIELPIAVVAGGDPVRFDQDTPENRGVLALNGGLGYQFTRSLGVEAGLGLTFPRILLEDPLVTRVINNDPESISIRVVSPAIIPASFQGVWTLWADRIISPYVAAGLLVADLGNQVVSSEPTDGLTAEGGLEFGYVIDLGAKLTLTDTWYANVGVRYGMLDDPELETEDGTEIPVEDIEIREIRLNLGLRFPGTLLPFVGE